MLPLLAAMAMLDRPSAFGAVSSARQIAWHEMQQYAFVHFGPNTFTDKEWGEGIEDPKLFNPTNLDCRQWVRTFKAAGLKGVVITAKHHDGFCLWPSKYSTHTVAQSLWKDGKGDVLKELSQACRAEGMKMGVYLSPWDRNHPTYGTPAYNQTFAHMLREVLTNYGPIFEVWFDGANGEGPNGKKQVYDWKLFIDTVRECQPNAVIFSDAGPDIRWVGNEEGHSAEECWCTIDRDRYYPGTPLSSELTVGKMGGTDWVPAECDVSIRPGWFYHSSQDSQVKSPDALLDIWERSVGQNANWILNVPPNRTGQIDQHDVAALMGFRKLHDEVYSHDLAKGGTAVASASREGFPAKNMMDGNENTFWAAPDGSDSATITFDLHKNVTFNRVELREPIQLGQRVAEFHIDAWNGAAWQTISNQTTIGNRRIVRVPTTVVSKLRIVITKSLAAPLISSFGLFNRPGA